MDPLFRGTPSAEGWYQVEDAIRLHYELYQPDDRSSSRGRIVMIMGAFGTKRHFASTASFLASNGYEVLTYDHRGVGKSGPLPAQRQSSLILAKDAMRLLDYVWGTDSLVHVYGASMGGMIAQELALLLLDRSRLASLGLAVTCRGLRPLGGLLAPLFSVRLLAPLLGWWYAYDAQRLVERLMAKLLTREVLAARHPTTGQTLETVYYREWLAHFDEYWTFRDPVAGACHAGVVLTHHLSEEGAAALRNSGVPILVQVSDHDLLIPPKMQRALARLLNAKQVSFPTGHMGLLPWAGAYHSMLLDHLATADILRAVAAADLARAQLQEEDAAAGQQQGGSGSSPAAAAAAAAAQLVSDAAVFTSKDTFPGGDDSSSNDSSTTRSNSLGTAPSSSSTEMDTPSEGWQAAQEEEAAAASDDTTLCPDTTAGPAPGSPRTTYLPEFDMTAVVVPEAGASGSSNKGSALSPRRLHSQAAGAKALQPAPKAGGRPALLGSPSFFRLG